MTPSKSQAIKTALHGDWHTATKINKALINNNPRDIEALNRLAFAFTITGKIKQAKSTYKKVLQIDPLNPIALKNIKRITGTSLPANKKNTTISIPVNYAFIEETGKTKIVELINIAPSKVIATLAVGQMLDIYIKRSKIFLKEQNKQYIGVLPDDIGKRLIKFVRGGNKYGAYVKSANSHSVVVFIKEQLRKTKFRDQPSFLQTLGNSLMFEKKSVKKIDEKKGIKIKDNDIDNNEEI